MFGSPSERRAQDLERLAGERRTAYKIADKIVARYILKCNMFIHG